MFFGAGAVMRAYQTKRIPSIRRVLKHFPVLGGLWLAGAVAITGAPPFALFLSELTMIRAGLAASQNVLIGLMAILLIVIFVGFLNQFRIMYFENGELNDPDARAVTPWMIAPMWLAIVPLLVMESGGRRRSGIIFRRSRCPSAPRPRRGRTMIGTQARTLSPDDLRSAGETLLAAGGRVRFAYAWWPAKGKVEVRYVSSVPDQRDFEIWVVKDFRELPSLAAIFPSIGWYEREMMDLNGLRFTDHPEPHPLLTAGRS